MFFIQRDYRGDYLYTKRQLAVWTLAITSCWLLMAPSAMAYPLQSKKQKSETLPPDLVNQSTPTNPKLDRVQDLRFFEERIRPVLIKKCYACHSAASDKQNGGLRLDTTAGIRQGGELGPAVIPGKPNESLLLSALRHDELEMPPSEKLPANVIGDFEKWIAGGAVDPRDDEKSDRPPPKEMSDSSFSEQRKSWAFQKPQVQNLPSIKQAAWPKNRIDYFVLKEMEDRGLSPGADASSHTLSRRLNFDLVGLPPAPNSISPKWVEAEIEQLISSPAFGEKWARLWLDVARYAEDQAHIVGNNKSLFYPNAFLYRDWVVAAFNEDLAYDQFVRRQLAVDLQLQTGEVERLTKYDERVALGFIGLGPKYYRRNDPSVMADEWEDRVDTVTRGLLGLTVACARCHDHKYDPITTKDYYALAGVFASTDLVNAPVDTEPKDGGKQDNPQNSKLTMHVVRDAKNPRDINVQIRGNAETKGDVVKRRFLTVLSTEAKVFQSGSGRLELANSIVDDENPLFARVMVNRVWAELIGKPIVSTPSNFGKLGGAPTHRELLDDLAERFVANDLSLKWLIREIVSSRTYQQASHSSQLSRSLDPSNRWLSRMNRRRLSVEQWRDAVLAVSNRLERTLGGPSMDPTNVKESRRTLYSNISRFDLNPLLDLFDFPDPNAHAAGRNQTITPLQKLFLLNGQFVITMADHTWQAATKSSDSDQQFVEQIYQAVYQRNPDDDEMQAAIQWTAEETGGTSRAQRQREMVHALLISNEFLYID